MRRAIETELTKWAALTDRRPLLVRGARQVGKSYSIREFGLSYFSDVVEVNFEQTPKLATCFETLIPSEIIDKLSILTRKRIEPGKTLLFLDEIQKCPAAITSLRYFFEQLPSLHVIAAGSLLEFALESAEISVPVGRIQYLFMKPMSFAEFCLAIGEQNAYSFLENGDCKKAGAAVHGHLMSLVTVYMAVGGMPAVVKRYSESKNISGCADLQTSIIHTFRDDFGKYAKKVRHTYLETMFAASAKMAGRRLKYTQVDTETRSRDLKEALWMLERAGVVYRVRSSSGAALPFEAEANERIFKMLFLDIGLMQNLCGLTGEIVSSKDLLSVYAGALAEQFAGQELLALGNPLQEGHLFFWTREKPGSLAEVDYLFAHGATIFPVEVKAGASGTLRSAHQFIEKYQRPLVLKISQAPYSYNPPVMNIPLYAIGSISGLIAKVYS